MGSAAYATYIIAEPRIDIKDRSCVDVCPVEAIFPEDALPGKWEPFVKIDYVFPDGMGTVNRLTDAYATERNVKNQPLD